VWEDINRNGYWDDGEPGLAGVVVTLRTSSYAFVARTTTDADGHFVFANVPAGFFLVEEADPPGYVSSTPNGWILDVTAGMDFWVTFGDYVLSDQFLPLLLRL
jgi:hypothetical protein